jgi:folate-dependent phosphoribosylglycinamide formyltransferase PurN
MRILLCTKRDLVGALVLNQLMPHLAGDQVMVLLSDKTRPAEKSLPELAEMKFLERDLPLDTLFPLVDRMGVKGAPQATFNGIAARYGTPMHTLSDINCPESEALVRDFAPDLILSVRFSLIFKRPVFDIPPLGTWNVHPGALPRYAGLFAPFRSMLEGQSRIGCTLHRIDDGIDTGPVVGIGWLPVNRRHSLLWHVVRAYQPGLDLFVDMLAGLRQGRAPQLMMQDGTQRVYVSMPDAAQFRAFADNGLCLSDPDEYREIIAGFLPPGLNLPDAVLTALEPAAGKRPDQMGAPCCYARA